MKKKLILLTTVILVTFSSLAQPNQIKPSLFGVSFNLTDFKAPKNPGNPSPGSHTGAGVSIYYWKGINPFIDFSARVNTIFNDHTAIYLGTGGKSKVAVELEPSLNLRLLKDQSVLSPFVTVGLGGGLYSDHFASYIPLGVGLQLNANSKTYFFLQGQYKWSISTEVLGNNLFYSLGFAQNFGGKHESAKPASLPEVVSKVVIADEDSDGIPDETDECPGVKGIASLKGCPDTDGDGIGDKDDKCPDTKGLIKYGGCPVPDTDKDGINDDEDNCPNESGLARYQGCPVPDTDKDGINDEEDKCPSVAGVASNMGCPEIDLAIIEKINKAAANIFFSKGSSKLLPGSSAALNNIAAILKSNSDYKVEINGYTDNKGDMEKNKMLSEQRAKSVSDYLIRKGIDESRLSVEGFGDENPVADNKTAVGRAKNRRVEMKVRNY